MNSIFVKIIGYDYADVRFMIAFYGYQDHIKAKGEEKQELKHPPTGQDAGL